MKEYIYPIIDMEKTGEWLRYLCKRKNIAVKDIQERLQIASNQAVYAWFNGKTLPSLNNMFALSEMIGIKINDMVVDDMHEHPFLRGRNGYEKRMLVYHNRLNRIV